MIRRHPRSTLSSSSAASDVYKRQGLNSFFNILNSIFCCISLRKTAWQAGTTGNKPPDFFVFLKDYFEPHIIGYKAYFLIFLWVKGFNFRIDSKKIEFI